MVDMQIDTPPPAPANPVDEEDDSGPLADMLTSSEDTATPLATRESLLTQIITDPTLFSIPSIRVKESACYALARLFCEGGKYDEVLPFVTTTCTVFFNNVTKAKVAKIVRQVLEVVSVEAPSELSMQKDVCTAVIAWCNACATPRTFLRQRVESKLAHVLFKQSEFTPALTLISALLTELKKLDDKALLVETHLVEAKIYHGLRNLGKAKAALTASRTAANAIYVAPAMQADIDRVSGTLHCEEGDYNTAHSYFLEAFEQLDQLTTSSDSTKCLKYMMLCKILDSLGKALKLSSKNVAGAKVGAKDADLTGLVSAKQAAKYASRDLEAMTAIAKAASKRDLKVFEKTAAEYSAELDSDLLIKHHLHILYEQMFESNLVRLVEPFSTVEIAHVAKLIDLDVVVVERKISQMILDNKLQGILDQGNGWLIVHESQPENETMATGVQLINSLGGVVDNLYERSQRELVLK